MTSESYAKTSFKIAFNSVKSLKSIGAYNLLITFFALLALTVTMSPAQAELLDSFNPQNRVVQTLHESNWLVKPDFQQASQHTSRYFKTAEMRFVFVVDEQGAISDIQVAESSGSEYIDRAFKREISTGRVKPFTLKGEPIKVKAILPIKLTSSQ